MQFCSLGRLLVVAGLFSTIMVGRAVGQRPGAQLGRSELPGLDWPANSAWRARVARISAHRWSLLERGDLRSLNQSAGLGRAPGAGFQASISPTAVTGSFHVPVLLIAYTNVAVAYPKANFQSVLFDLIPPNGRPYTLKTFYEQLSRNRIQMTGRVFDPVKADSTHEYYENNCNGIGVYSACSDGGQRFGDLLITTLDSVSKRADSATVWNDFDNDGPDGLPNSGDDDGSVDFVTFLQPTVDGACSGEEGIWSHRWVIAGWNGGSPYVTKTRRRDANGQPIPGQYITVNNYTIQSQVGGANGCSGNAIMPIGTVAHETGHAFGLPDLYDTGNGTEGIGEWGLMGSGNYARPLSPASYDAWSLNELGWITVDTLAGTRTVVTGPRQLSDTIFIARLDDPREFLFVENRQAVYSDTALLGTGFTATQPYCLAGCRKQPGLLLWHVDLDRIAFGRPTNSINTGSIHGVALVQADGLNQLRSLSSNRNRGDYGDPYPGFFDKVAWRFSSLPAARTNQGDYAGFVIDSIDQLSGGTMSFRFVRRRPSVVATSRWGFLVTVNGATYPRFEDAVAAGDELTVSIDSIQSGGYGGRSIGRFLGWSDGGARTHTIVSGAVPDTLIASLSVEHLLQVTNAGNGAGSYSASVAGDLVAGVYFPDGLSITLTASPAAGSIFGGWMGDTSGFNPTMVLPMRRPFTLEARFVTEVSITLDQARAEILGTATLSLAQKTFSDQLGNRNGIFDVGDYLALVQRDDQLNPTAATMLTAPLEAGTGAARREEGP